jgi:spore coat polysaccharide biosynthesis protein SpsF (cytidylyltransferase family)
MVIAVIQARMDSERLPGKVMKDIIGKPMLYHVIHRVKQSKQIGDVVLATSIGEQDKQLVDFAKRLGVKTFAGSEHDVLDRFLRVTEQMKVEAIVRITADCPLIEPEIIDQVVKLYKENPSDYVFIAGYPRGTGDAEVLTASSLKRSCELTRPEQQYYREHVMTFITEQPEIFSIKIAQAPEELRRPNYRLCVDEVDDLTVVRKIYEHFAPRVDFTLAEIIGFLDSNPEIAKINQHVQQKIDR